MMRSAALSHGVFSRPPGKPWRLVHPVAGEQAGHAWIIGNRDRFVCTVELTVAPLRPADRCRPSAAVCTIGNRADAIGVSP